jgi:hypothetical protein
MAALWNDGTIPYGSEVLTINSVTYIAENVSFDNPSTVVQRRNEANEPTGSYGVQDFVTGSATLQKAATGTAVPTPGLTFTRDSVVYILTKVGEVLAQGDAMKFNIEFQRQYD